MQTVNQAQAKTYQSHEDSLEQFLNSNEPLTSAPNIIAGVQQSDELSLLDVSELDYSFPKENQRGAIESLETNKQALEQLQGNTKGASQPVCCAYVVLNPQGMTKVA